MSDAFVAVPILFMVIVAPVWIISHYVTRWRIAKTLSADDERMLADLWHGASEMENRVHQLEKILDAEAPGWRARQ